MKFLWKKCIESREIASIFCDKNNPSKHLTGFISAVNDDEIVVEHISPYGQYDGYVLFPLKDVFRVDLSGHYEKKILRLYLLKGQEHPKLNYTYEKMHFSIFEYSLNNTLIVSVELEEETLTGYVLNFDLEYVCLRLIDEYGRENGTTNISCNDIVSIAMDTLDEQALKLLTQDAD